MELQYIKNDPDWKPKKYKVYDCPYNDGCHCSTMDCHRCGWNPKVAATRMKKTELKKVGAKA